MRSLSDCVGLLKWGPLPEQTKHISSMHFSETFDETKSCFNEKTAFTLRTERGVAKICDCSSDSGDSLSTLSTVGASIGSLSVQFTGQNTFISEMKMRENQASSEEL